MSGVVYVPSRLGKSALGDHGTTGRWRRIRSRILKRDRYVCQMCGFIARPSSDGKVRGLVVDHIKPREAGGTDAPENLRTLCAPCEKTTRVPSFPIRESPGPAVRALYGPPYRGVPVHECGTTPLPVIRGDTTAGRWERPGCPPNCPRAA